MRIEVPSGRRKLVDDLKTSIAAVEERDFLLDTRRLFQESRIKYESRFEELKIENKPTIFAVNHFKRKVWDRLSIHPTHMFGNTRESFVVAGLVSVGAKELSLKSSSWLIKADIRTKVGSITLHDAAMQKGFIEVYDHIAIPENATRETVTSMYERAAEKLRKGKNIGVFAEEEPSYQMQKDGEILKNVLKIFRNRGTSLQVVPVSVFYDGLFIVHFSKPIQAGFNPKQDAEAVITSIASKLPQSMRP